MRKALTLLLLLILMGGMAHPASALTVSPARVEIVGDPGTTLHGEIEIFNEQEGKRTFFSSSENFEPSGDSGAPHFVGNKDGLATWITTPAEISLESGERKVVPYSVTIPKDAEPGGYFAALFFGNQPPQLGNSGEVSVGGKIGVLVLLRVSGEVKEEGGLAGFSTVENKRFYSDLPIAFSYRVTNKGGDRIVPQGELKIKNTLRLTSAQFLANKGSGSVLPNSTRKFEVTWGEDRTQEKSGFFKTAYQQLKHFHLGWYVAKLNLTWGESQQTAQSSYHFFIVPWQLLSIIFVCVIFVSFTIKIALAKYKRSIIKQMTDTK